MPVVDYLTKAPANIDRTALYQRHGIEVSNETNGSNTILRLKLRDSVPSADTWLEALAGQKTCWLRALLRSVSIVQGSSYINNPIARVFQPRRGQIVEIVLSEKEEPLSIALYGAARSADAHDAGFKAVEIQRKPASDDIIATLFEERLGEAVPLALAFKYRPDQPFAPIHEVMEGRNQRIKEFCKSLNHLASPPAR